MKPRIFPLLTRFQQHWRVPAYLSIALVICSAVNITLFHTLIELFAVGVAVMGFVVSWNTYSFSRNKGLLFLGCGYLSVGILDLFHTLTFENMFIFEQTTPSTTLQFWLGARYFEVFTLLFTSTTVVKRFKPSHILITFCVLTFGYTSLSLTQGLPELYIQDQGLTLTKIAHEYVIILLLMIVAYRLYKASSSLDPQTRTLLLSSTVLTILAEMNFTLYTNMSSLNLIAGHIFKLLSFWAIYRLLIEASLTRPIDSLTQVLNSYDKLPEPTVIIDRNGLIVRANKLIAEQFGKDITGRDCHELMHVSSISKDECKICQAYTNNQSLKAHEFYDSEKQSWFEASLSAVHYSEAYSSIVHTVRDITSRKHSEFQYSSLNRVYRVLSHTNQAIVRLQDRTELFQKICDIAIEQGNLKMAWIGIVDNTVVKPKYVSGDDDGYFEKMQMRIDKSEWARGPVGVAVNTKQVAYVNDVDTNPDFWPWRQAAIDRGFAALAAVPLFFKREVVAVFTLYSEQKNVFDSEMASLLSHLSNDISSALFHIDQSQQKLITDSKLRYLSRAVEQSADAIIITDIQKVIEYVNPEFTELTGYTATEAIGKNISIIRSDVKADKRKDKAYNNLWNTVESGQQWRGELRSKKKNGELYWSNQTIAPIKNELGITTHYVSTSTDNTKLHDAQEKIQQLAFYDPLTKLANRRLLMDRLKHAVSSSERHHEKVAVFLCDLDNFKHINDSLGHDYGDQLLLHVAGILEKGVHSEDTVARLGGDEFTVVITSFQNELGLAEIASQILSNLQEPVKLKDKQVVISTSIGIAMYPQDGDSGPSLLRAADLAMYHAKEDGKNRFQFYQQEMNTRAQGRLSLEHELREAIKHDEFELYYQPQVNIDTKAIIGFEALLRWKTRSGTYLPPSEFIPIAEESGLIGQIGDWVISQAISDWDKLLSWGFERCRMAINVSAFQFKHADNLIKVIIETLQKHPSCNTNDLTIELTESTLIEDIEGTINTLTELKNLGILLSIDDFGTGYSSLNYLKRFPVDQLKIDKSFIDDILNGESDEAIVTTIISIAQKLKMKVIAEGVEQEAQANYLSKHECLFAQGYLFHKPLPMVELRKLQDK